MKNSEIRNSEIRNSEIRKIFNKEIMEIIIAIILSLFIILDIRFSNNITNMLNTPIGLISLFLIIKELFFINIVIKLLGICSFDIFLGVLCCTSQSFHNTVLCFFKSKINNLL